jgi:hypothetical protein
MTKDSYILSVIKEYARHERNRGRQEFHEQPLRDNKLVMLGHGGAFDELLDLIDELEGNKKRSIVLQRL